MIKKTGSILIYQGVYDQKNKIHMSSVSPVISDIRIGIPMFWPFERSKRDPLVPWETAWLISRNSPNGIPDNPQYIKDGITPTIIINHHVSVLFPYIIYPHMFYVSHVKLWGFNVQPFFINYMHMWLLVKPLIMMIKSPLFMIKSPLTNQSIIIQ